MIADNGIRIQNIYHMLAYVFSSLQSNGYEELGSEEFENTAELLSAILAKGIAFQVKRGLGKEYIPISEPLSTLKGKIDIAQSIKGQTMLKKQLVCNYDEFSINTKCNQIIKTTVDILLRENIGKKRKRELKNLMMFFRDVDILNPYIIDWNIRFNRNNQSYQMLISICHLIIDGLLQKDENGDVKMQKYLHEQGMAKLYEKFILGYYKQHFPMFKVSAPQISWDIDENAGNEGLLHLPRMQSDTIISTKSGDKILIIDAKFYGKSMATNRYDGKRIFHSHNLYQIFTYVKNKDKANKGNVSGMLLYAKTDEEITPNAQMQMGVNKIMIRNLDMNRDFREIKKQLNDLIGFMLEET